MTKMERLSPPLSVVHTSMGTMAMMEMEVIHPTPANRRTSSGTRGEAYLLSLHRRACGRGQRGGGPACPLIRSPVDRPSLQAHWHAAERVLLSVTVAHGQSPMLCAQLALSLNDHFFREGGNRCLHKCHGDEDADHGRYVEGPHPGAQVRLDRRINMLFHSFLH